MADLIVDRCSSRGPTQTEPHWNLEALSDAQSPMKWGFQPVGETWLCANPCRDDGTSGRDRLTHGSHGPGSASVLGGCCGGGHVEVRAVGFASHRDGAVCPWESSIALSASSRMDSGVASTKPSARAICATSRFPFDGCEPFSMP